jgi:hypothetical protein
VTLNTPPLFSVHTRASLTNFFSCVMSRQGWKPLHTMMGHKDFIYSLAVSKGLCFSGAGDGSLICHSLSDGSILYGLGANKAAVRCIGLASDTLIASGDDGNLPAILLPCPQ